MLKHGIFIFAFLFLIAHIIRFFQFGQAWYHAETQELHACHAVGSVSGNDVSEFNRYIQDGTIPPMDVYWILSQCDDLHCTQASITQMTPLEQVINYIGKNANTLEKKQHSCCDGRPQTISRSPISSCSSYFISCCVG